jgi:hypothetical protein
MLRADKDRSKGKEVVPLILREGQRTIRLRRSRRVRYRPLDILETELGTRFSRAVYSLSYQMIGPMDPAYRTIWDSPTPTERLGASDAAPKKTEDK